MMPIGVVWFNARQASGKFGRFLFDPLSLRNIILDGDQIVSIGHGHFEQLLGGRSVLDRFMVVGRFGAVDVI